MATTQDIHHTVDLSDLSLEPISPQMIDKYDIPTETAGAVITSRWRSGRWCDLENAVRQL